MAELLPQTVSSPLFAGIRQEDRRTMLNCIGFSIRRYPKGSVIALEDESIRYIGILLSGAVDMVKEDLWGNKTTILRLRQEELFGESFACGEDDRSLVTFLSAEDTSILFLPFHKVMHTCSRSCVFHRQLVENMVRVIAGKNREFLRKVEVISKKTLREKILAYLSLQSQLQGSRYFSLPLNRAELADYLCADRSALSRELSAMRSEGLIDFDRNLFRILV